MNKYKTGKESTYRVVGHPIDGGIREFLQGPYVLVGVAKGQCTRARNEQEYNERVHHIAPKFSRIVVEVSPADWTELDY